jgi:hypothetical protein
MNTTGKGQFSKGNPGKPKGAKNHITKTVKETVLSVFNELQDDNEASLIAWAKKKPGEFYQIAARLIPTELKADMPEGTEFSITLKI